MMLLEVSTFKVGLLWEKTNFPGSLSFFFENESSRSFCDLELKALISEIKHYDSRNMQFHISFISHIQFEDIPTKATNYLT